MNSLSPVLFANCCGLSANSLSTRDLKRHRGLDKLNNCKRQLTIKFMWFFEMMINFSLLI